MEQPSKASLSNKRLWEKCKIMKKWIWVPATKLSPSNLVASKNFAKTLLYLSVYISLNSGIVATKYSNKS